MHFSQSETQLLNGVRYCKTVYVRKLCLGEPTMSGHWRKLLFVLRFYNTVFKQICMIRVIFRWFYYLNRSALKIHRLQIRIPVVFAWELYKITLHFFFWNPNLVNTLDLFIFSRLVAEIIFCDFCYSIIEFSQNSKRFRLTPTHM